MRTNTTNARSGDGGGKPKHAPPTLILVVAVLVVFSSSGLALTNAYLFRSGYPYQSTVLALQQLLCTSFGVVAMQVMPTERAKLRISQKNYVGMLLPFSAVLAAKLFLQNKAVQYVSPAFYAMTASMLPVGVTFMSLFVGMSNFKWSTVVAAAFVSFGGILIKAGQVQLSAVGFALTVSSLLLAGRGEKKEGERPRVTRVVALE